VLPLGEGFDRGGNDVLDSEDMVESMLEFLGMMAAMSARKAVSCTLVSGEPGSAKAGARAAKVVRVGLPALTAVVALLAATPLVSFGLADSGDRRASTRSRGVDGCC
jgi:hypothetical protein